MGKIILEGFVPKDDPMFTRGASMFTRPENTRSANASGEATAQNESAGNTTRYKTGVVGMDSVTEEVLLEAARSLIRGDLFVAKDVGRRYTIRGSDGPIVRRLTGAQVALFMVATTNYYSKNGSIHMGRRFLFADIKKPDLSR
jgi:hypothetical protein